MHHAKPVQDTVHYVTNFEPTRLNNSIDIHFITNCLMASG
jgi:hypothetical protein